MVRLLELLAYHCIQINFAPSYLQNAFNTKYLSSTIAASKFDLESM